jgi:hypothetical protein
MCNRTPYASDKSYPITPPLAPIPLSLEQVAHKRSAQPLDEEPGAGVR